MIWPAAGSRVRRLRGTKEIGFSKNFVSDNATALQDTLYVKISHLAQRACF